jgi:hypothetical protein
MFLSAVTARRDKMVGMVETMMTADSLRLTACGLQLTADRLGKAV